MTNFFKPLLKINLLSLLIVLNLGIYVAQGIKGVDWISPELYDLVGLGGNVAPLTLIGEPWRLLSSMFLHSGLFHVVINMYMLLSIGYLTITLFGSTYFGIIYFVSGLSASLTSALWYGYHKSEITQHVFGQLISSSQLTLIVSVGASGAIMGLAGACLVSTFWTRHNHLNTSTPELKSALIQTIVINLGLGFFTTGVDNACHTGGIISGMIIGALLMAVPPHWQALKRNLTGLAIASAFIGQIYSGTQLPPPEDLQTLATDLKQDIAATEAEKQLAVEVKQINEQIDIDAKNTPAPVSEKTAAGLTIALDFYTTGITSSADGKLLYMPYVQDNTLNIFDTETNKFRKNITGPVIPEQHQGASCPDNVCLGIGANYVALSPDGRFAYVSSMVQDAVAVIDLQQQKMTASIPTGRYPGDLQVSSDGQFGYVINIVDNSVSKLDLKANQMIGTAIVLSGGSAENLPFGRALGIWLSKDNQRLFVIDAVANAMEVFETRDMKKITVVPLSPDNYFHAAAKSINQSIIWIKGRSALETFNTKTNTFDKTLAICQDLGTFTVDSNADNSLIALAIPQYVMLVKPYTRKLVGLFPNAGMPDKVQFSADGQHLYVVNNNTNTLAIIDPKQSMDKSAFLENSMGEPLCALSQ